MAETILPLELPPWAPVLTAIAFTMAGCSSQQPSPSGFEAASHVPYPQIPTGGGPTIGGAQIVTVSLSGDLHTPDLTKFVDWIAASGWLTTVAGEYGVRSVEHRAHVDLDPGTASILTDDDVKALLAAKIGDGTIPSGPASSPPWLYVLYFPDGMSITRQSGEACSGNPGNGYHDALDPNGPPFVVVPSCEPRFSATFSEVEGMELETARLLVDALTDPSPRNEPAYALTDVSSPWTSMGAELGDFCWGRLAQEGPGYRLQRVWSNAAAARGGEPCVPVPSGSVPFGIAASPSTLQDAKVGKPLDFTLTGWSQTPVASWSIQASPWVGDFTIETALDRGTLNNGQTTVLHVTIPYAVAPGTYGAVRVQAMSGPDSPSWPVAFVVR